MRILFFFLLTAVVGGSARYWLNTGPTSGSHWGSLRAELIESGFADAHDTYNGISCASDGNIYYVLCSKKANVSGRIYRYDPAVRQVQLLGDLSEIVGESASHTIAQGKSHVNFVESGGKLFFATHVGYYTIVDGTERMPEPPPGMRPYPGGHFVSYDLKTGKFEKLATAPGGEGILTFAMDIARERLYGLTWPSGRFLTFSLHDRRLRDLGPVSHQGESAPGPEYRSLCRSFAIDPRDGAVYFTTAEGTILRYDPHRDAIAAVAEDDLRKDYFGQYDPASPGQMGYNWRQSFWYAPERAVYGVHGNSGYLFRYLPDARLVEVIERITAEPSRRSGMFDQFSYGYLGFALGPDNRTIYYLTGGALYENGRRVRGKAHSVTGESKGPENLHLVTWDIPARRYTDHGPIFLPGGVRPNWVNSIAVGKDGAVYALTRVSESPNARTDLMRIPPLRLK
jgi:hypothetical protein